MLGGPVCKLMTGLETEYKALLSPRETYLTELHGFWPHFGSIQLHYLVKPY